MPRLLTSKRAGIPPTALFQALGSIARITETAASKELQKSLAEKGLLSYVKIA